MKVLHTSVIWHIVACASGVTSKINVCKGLKQYSVACSNRCACGLQIVIPQMHSTSKLLLSVYACEDYSSLVVPWCMIAVP